MLEIGTKAPDFSLPDQNGEIHSLEEYKGKKAIPQAVQRRLVVLPSDILSS